MNWKGKGGWERDGRRKGEGWTMKMAIKLNCWNIFFRFWGGGTKGEKKEG